MDGNGEMETVVVYGEIVLIKLDRIILIFRCQVIQTIVSQYCSHWSSAGVARYIQFREPKPVEEWECRQARTRGKVVLSRHTIQATICAAMSHAIFLSETWMITATVKQG
jgi:hypothetical protein